MNNNFSPINRYVVQTSIYTAPFIGFSNKAPTTPERVLMPGISNSEQTLK